MGKKKVFKTEDIRVAFRKKYAQPEWAALFEVSNGTGVNGGRRYADAMAMSLWPSRGLHLHGFEFKVSRSDWTKELKDPSKAEMLMQRCHFWWVITANDIVKPGEMPHNWGHIKLTGRGLEVTKPAPLTKADDLTWEWFAALMRRAGQVTSGTIEAEVRDRVKSMEDRFQERVQREVARRTDAFEDMKKIVDRVHEVFGTDPKEGLFGGGYEIRQLIEAAHVVKEAGLSREHSTLMALPKTLRAVADRVDAIAAPFRKDDEPAEDRLAARAAQDGRLL